MGRVDEAPAPVDRSMGEQPLGGALAGPGEAVVDLSGLFGDVDVDGAGEIGDAGEVFGGDGAEGVGGDAEGGVVERGDGGPRAVEEGGEGVEVVDEARLARAGGLGAEAAVRVEDGQQSEADAGLDGGGGDAGAEFGRVVVGAAAGRVVQVVELGQRGEAGLEHLQHGEGGDGFDVVWGKFLQEGVHDLAPGPEIIAGGAASFGEAGHSALEGVAVQVGKAGQRDAGDTLALLWAAAGDKGSDGAVVDVERDVLGPAGGKQGGVEEEAAGRHGLRCRDITSVDMPAGSCRLGGMLADTIWTNARLLTMTGAPVDRGAVAAREGRIVYAGPADGAPGAVRSVDCAGRWITPGLVDCHTHLVFGGDRGGGVRAAVGGGELRGDRGGGRRDCF